MKRILHIPPRHVGLAALCLLSLVYLGLFHYNRFGIDEGAARGLLLNWAIGSEVISPVAVLGFPDMRALLFSPLNFHWIGELSAAKVLTMYLTFATALMLYRWAERNLGDETALFATGLWLVAPLTISQTDSIGAGNYLAFCAIAAHWLDQYLRASTRTVSGYYFLLVLVLALAASMHPAGLGMAFAVAWSWFRNDGGNARRRTALIAGMGTIIAFVLVSRMGWPELETFNNPIHALAGVLIGDLSHFQSLPLGFGLIAAVLLVLAVIAALRRSRDLFTMMLIFGIVFGLLSTDQAWSQLALLLILFEGIKALISLNSRLSATSLAARRGLVALAVFALSFIFMIGDKERFLLKADHRLQPSDEVISELVDLTQGSGKPVLTASQWPGRTMLATRMGALPLPPAKDDPEAFLRQMHGVTYIAFDQGDEHNKALRRQIAELSDRIKTVSIMEGGVIVQLPPSKAQQQR
ncbi:MAG TPA: hypothetical protein VNH42_00270 [Mariprofundaceae bacterium]|nr:hypothetical protein [Mariprofundaceae bacterium]